MDHPPGNIAPVPCLTFSNLSDSGYTCTPHRRKKPNLPAGTCPKCCAPTCHIVKLVETAGDTCVVLP